MLSTRRLVLAPLDTSGIDAPDRPTDWPEAGLADALRELCRQAGDSAWRPWLLRFPEGAVVGDAGFKGPPDDDGVVEMGWYIRPSHRGRGLASEAIRALIDWALTERARAFRAEIHRDNAPSLRAAARAGFRPMDGDGGDPLYLWLEKR